MALWWGGISRLKLLLFSLFNLPLFPGFLTMSHFVIFGIWIWDLYFYSSLPLIILFWRERELIIISKKYIFND